VDLSVAIASKILRRQVTREDNEALIQEALKQVESQPSV
jgi:F0F1-type ATP synthase membrane subunit b/b'